jgi:hypothetical protein
MVEIGNYGSLVVPQWLAEQETNDEGLKKYLRKNFDSSRESTPIRSRIQ